MLTVRFTPFAAKVISSLQTAFIPNRYILEGCVDNVPYANRLNMNTVKFLVCCSHCLFHKVPGRISL